MILILAHRLVLEFWKNEDYYCSFINFLVLVGKQLNLSSIERKQRQVLPISLCNPSITHGALACMVSNASMHCALVCKIKYSLCLFTSHLYEAIGKPKVAVVMYSHFLKVVISFWVMTLQRVVSGFSQSKPYPPSFENSVAVAA